VLETWLGNGEGLGELLTLHQESEIIATVVRMVYLSDLNGIISKEVVDDEGKVVEAGEESQNTTIIIQELLLALHTATTEGLLHILLERGVADLWLGDLSVSKEVHGDALSLGLR
jgi:hypothetical protein